MSRIPEVRIYYAWLLVEEGYRLVKNPEKKTDEQFKQWSENYKKAWSKHETQILIGLQEALGVRFYKPVIDVPCAPYFIPKSDPLLMSFKEFPDEFIDVLTHELCHVLLTDNDKMQINGKKSGIVLGSVWEELFGKHDFGTLVHIPVQALLKHIYLDILGEPKRLKRDIEKSQSYGPAYIDSWKYVQNDEYKDILTKLKKSYSEMPA